ncbi:MAG: protein kinase domain-containing protein [Akkermansiaceae bacterium]
MKEEFVLSGLKPDELMARGMLTEAGSGNLSHWVPPAVNQLERIVTGYKVDSMIAKGGMGAVYNVTQRDLNRVCALKLLPLEVSEEPGFEDRFILEARAMASLNHPNIMTIYDFGRTSEGHVYYVMEFVDGLDLSELIKQGDLEESRAMEILMQVCDALEYAHESGFVHRDVKPANIMIDKLGRVKVTDFGLAKLLNNDTNYGVTKVGQVMGTPDYMAPEQSTGHGVDCRADIYALGVMLYELLTGTLPKGIFAPPSLKAQVDVKYDEVVIKAMQQQPELRFQNISELKLLLQDAHQSSISRAKSKFKSKSKQKPKWSSTDTKAWTISAEGGQTEASSNGLKAFMGLAFIALIGAGAYWYSQNGGENFPVQDKPKLAAIDNIGEVDVAVPVDNTDVVNPVLDLVDSEIHSLVLDIKSSRNELIEQERRAEQARQDALLVEEKRLTEEAELAKRAAEKRELAFLVAQNSQLAVQLSEGGERFPDDFSKAVDLDLLEDGARGGDVAAQFLLGKMYQQGIGVSQNEEIADGWYKMASAQGHEGAKLLYREKFFELGLKYYHGDGVTQDYGKALENFQKAAERDNVIAMNLLGWMYDAGEGVEKNLMQSTSWYRKSAELGYASAQYNLAECYKEGYGVEKDFKEAMSWYRKSAEQGNERAIPHLGDFYREGIKSGMDPKEAVRWITEAAENGDAASQCDLGKLYVIGKGVKRDPKMAVSWLRRSAEQGYARGQHNLGKCYENGIGVIKSDKSALEWYMKSSEQGHPEAQRDLGNMYADGKVVKKNSSKAVELHLKAAEAGIVESQYNMGVFYTKGLGVKKNSKLAVKWYTMAAEQGHILSQYNLGVCYYNGVGVGKRSAIKAKEWFTKAAVGGNENAKKALKKLK